MCSVSLLFLDLLALPGKSFSLINLLQTPPELAIQYVARHVGK
jgi:hypothetical protein